MSFRGRIRKLQRAMERDMIVFELKDGTRAWFYEDELFPGCFLHEWERGRRHFEGEDPGPAHPFVEALRDAAPGEVERLVPTQGTVITLWLGEDEVIRGERKRTGSSVRETSPGHYE